MDATACRSAERHTSAGTNLELGGYVERPLSLCASTLAAMPSRLIPYFSLSCASGELRDVPMRYRATLLAPVVQLARPGTKDRTEFKRLAVIAEAADGHRALFSWMELFHTQVGAGVYLAFDCDDAPFAPGTGKFALLSLQDDYTAPRYVRNLVRVCVQRIW